MLLLKYSASDAQAFYHAERGKRKMTPVCDIFTDILKSGWKKSDLRSARYEDILPFICSCDFYIYNIITM